MIKVKHIEAAREVRLWLAQIVGPAMAVYIMAHPEVIDRIKDASVVSKIKQMFGL